MKFLKTSLLAAMALIASLSASAQSMTVADASGEPGETITLSIAMENGSVKINGFQCDIYLPDGVTVETDEYDDLIAELSSRRSDHVISGSQQSDGAYRFLSYSPKNRNYSGTSGEIFTIPVKLDAAPGEYTIRLSKIQFSEGGTSRKIECDDTTATLTITGGANPDPDPDPDPDPNPDPDPDQPNSIFTPDVSICRGTTSLSLPVYMKNEVNVASFQMELMLPEGIRVKSFRLSDRAQGRVTPMGNQVDNYIFVGLYSGGDAIQAGEGEFVTFDLEIDADMEPGTYYIKILNGGLTAEDLTDIELPNTEAVLTINDYVTGDVNNDGKINMTDATTIAYHVLRKNTPVFIEPAADVNGDGKINMTDATTVAYYVLKKIESFNK